MAVNKLPPSSRRKSNCDFTIVIKLWHQRKKGMLINFIFYEDYFGPKMYIIISMRKLNYGQIVCFLVFLNTIVNCLLMSLMSINCSGTRH